MIRTFFSATILFAWVLLCASCKPEKTATADVTTGATILYQPNGIMLPPENGNYKVLGVLDGLKNYVVQYDDHVFRGGEPYSEAAAESLHRQGIKTIISITPTDHERVFCAEHGFALMELPFNKDPGPEPEQLRCYLTTIRSGAGPFYIHCHGGSHRGGVLGLAYRLHLQEWSEEKALVEFGRLGGDLKADHTMIEAVVKLQR